MTIIRLEFTFEAAHQLPPYPLHGHSFRARCSLRRLPKNGFVKRFEEVEEICNQAKAALDHKYLNDIMEVPSLENLAEYICTRWGFDQVEVFRDSCGQSAVYPG